MKVTDYQSSSVALCLIFPAVNFAFQVDATNKPLYFVYIIICIDKTKVIGHMDINNNCICLHYAPCI